MLIKNRLVYKKNHSVLKKTRFIALNAIVFGVTSFSYTLGHASESSDLTDISFERLLTLEVVTASKIPQKISEAPSAVSVITADDIKHYGYLTLGDILRSIRGIYVTYDRNYSYVGTRGLGRPGDFNTRLLILVDGRRLNDSVYNQGAAGSEFPIDVELIERVEFVPGPGSAIYGSSAFFGVINVITKSGAAIGGIEVSATKGSYDTSKARISFGKKLDNGTDLLVSASRLNSGGQNLYFPEFDNQESNGGTAQGLDYDRYKRLFAKLSLNGLTFETFFGERIKGIPTASYGQQFNDPRSRTIDKYSAASLSYRRELSNTLELYGSLSLNQYRYSGDYIYAFQSATVNRDEIAADSWGSELRLLATGIRNHKIIAGMEYQSDFKRSLDNFDDRPFVSYLSSNTSVRGLGIYVQDEMRLNDALIVNAGIRHDRTFEKQRSTNPRLALIYKATPALALKGLYGTAFRAANANERYYITDASRFKSNPNLRSENIKTYELVAEYFPTDRLRASASLFRYRFEDLISLATDPSDGRLFYSNIEAARSQGAELEVEWQQKGGSRLKGSVAFQYAKDSVAGQWLTNSPKQLAKLNYSTPVFGDAIRTSIEYQWTGKRKTGLVDEIGSFGILNFNVFSSKLAKNLEISTGIYNAFDKRYADAPSEEHFDNGSPPSFLRSIGQNGRNWRATATYRF